MSGADKTNTARRLFGIGVPYAVTFSGVANASGAYTVASPEPAAVTVSGDTTTALSCVLANGDLPSGVLAAQMQVIAPGGPGRAGIAYRASADGTTYGAWHGADAHTLLTGDQLADTASASCAHHDLVEMDAGQMLCTFVDTALTYSMVRSAAGVWGSRNIVNTNLDDPCATWRGIDGAFYNIASRAKPGTTTGSNAYSIRRSTDGVTWTTQTFDSGIAYDGSNDRRLRVAALRSSVVAFLTTNTGASSVVTQWASTDGVNFTLVGTSAVPRTVWDVRAHDGVLYALMVDDVGGTDQLALRTIGSAFQNVWDGSPSLVVAGARAHTSWASLAIRPEDGALVVLDYLTAASVAARTSTNGGTTWTATDALLFDGAWTKAYGPISAAFWRGTLLGVGGNGTAGETVELRWGGHTPATVSGSARDWEKSWIPGDTLAAGGWAYTATLGAPTLSLSPSTGQRIQTGGADAARFEYNSGAFAVPAIFEAVVRVAAGRWSLSAFVATRLVQIDVTSTGIRIYDPAGAAPAYTTHGISGDILIVAAASNSGTAFAAFGAYDGGHARTLTDLPAVSGLPVTVGTDVIHRMSIDVSSDVYIRFAAASRAASSALSDGWSRPGELDPILVAPDPVYLTGGLSVKLAQGVPSVDGVTHAVALTSPYKLENADPRVLPTPRTGWRSNGLHDETIVATLDEPDVPGLSALCFGGLIGVSKVVVNGTTIDLAQAFAYDGTSRKVIVPSRSGSAAPMPWVRADELRGWRFKDAANTIHTVTGNSEGSLTGGSTIAERRAVIYLDTASDTVTTGAGVLYPARAVIYGHTAVSAVQTGLTIGITSADQYTPTEGYREIALMGLFRVHVLGVGADLDHALAVGDDAAIQTLPNGQRYSARRAVDSQTTEFSWMLSPRETTQQRGLATSPDYQTTYTGGGPAADRDGVPDVIRSILARSRGDGVTRRDVPVLLCPSIERQASVGLYLRVWNMSEVYGRIVGPVRIEHLPGVGQWNVSQVARVARVSIEAER